MAGDDLGAAAWLRLHAGVERLVFIGLRIGGTLAAMAAAAREDVVGLALVEPCMTGRSYASQLAAEARMRGAQQPDGSIEVGELHLTPECLAQMRGVELARLTLAARLARFCFFQKLHGENRSAPKRPAGTGYPALLP